MRSSDPIRREYRRRPWFALRAVVLARAGGQCECRGECGIMHTARPAGRCPELHGQLALFARGRVVLSVAHLDHAPPVLVDPGRLRALCQRCHLRYDEDEHQSRIRARRIARLIEAGQLALPGVDLPR